MIDAETLLDLAIDHYNARSNGNYVGASRDSDPDFLERIQVNFLRHELTNYDWHLGQLKGYTGVEEARGRVRERVLDAIAEAYPDLASECSRQSDRVSRLHFAKSF